ncbi:MAG: ATP-binding protein [Spirochaetales bacterium]|nr:ATP-binding protein [Spirochaetales bacterium]
MNKKIANFQFTNITVELRNWFAANMCAALGGILNTVSAFNNISFHADPNIELILRKNCFLTQYGYKNCQDNNNTTIQYLKLKPEDKLHFAIYINNELLGKKNMPKMSPLLKSEISKSICEIFENAVLHSETDYIYCCGQFFPTKNAIEFTIVDMGQGIKQCMEKRFGCKINSDQAIKMAVSGITTKLGVSGGLGLSLLKRFIQHNHGRLQIVSDDGFYELGNNETFNLLDDRFPGTIVNMKFKTDDECAYILSSEATV